MIAELNGPQPGSESVHRCSHRAAGLAENVLGHLLRDFANPATIRMSLSLSLFIGGDCLTIPLFPSRSPSYSTTKPRLLTEVHDGITYDFPRAWGHANDNVVANGQIIELKEPTYVHELYSVHSGDASGKLIFIIAHEFVANFVLNFADNSTQQLQLYAKNWWRWPILNNGVIRTPYSFQSNEPQKNRNSFQIYQWSTAIPSEHPLASITLLPVNTAHRLHLFPLSISPSYTPATAISPSSTASASTTAPVAPALVVRRARFTTRWAFVGGQAVEVTLANLLPSFTLSRSASIMSAHRVEVVGARCAGEGGVEVGVAGGDVVEEWTPEKEVLARHETPAWKHHDGFSFFDTGNTPHLSSVHLGPKHDLVAELLDTAQREKPDLHRSTMATRNTDLNLTDYIDDLQLPHILDLATKYDTEIMLIGWHGIKWCDIGGPNKMLEFAAQFYNHALAQGRQVTMNNRCGAVPDFETPEYATFGSIQSTSWGLLDIGPTAEGEIIAPMMEGLLDTGAWLNYSGSCIYDTYHWFPGAQDANPPVGAPAVRFFSTPSTFCIVAFAPPTNGQLVVNKRLPLLPGDTLTLWRPGGRGVEVAWTMDAGTGQLVVDVSEDDLADGRFAWAFEARYQVD
ncbi:glycoside hydrolase superfamily [Mycena crocata]|nr:glycoside hydrolase superfamily [Mycena crocata]